MTQPYVLSSGELSIPVPRLTRRKIINITVSVVLILSIGCILSLNTFAADKLLYSNDLTYLGAFKVPAGSYGGSEYDTFSYSGAAIAFNPANNSLFISSHINVQYVGEINIPTPVNSSNINSIPSATVRQNAYDIMEGHRTHIKAGGAAETTQKVNIGGLWIDTVQNKLIGTVFNYYDGDTSQELEHFTSGLTLSTSGDFTGMWKVGANFSGIGAGYKSGYMTAVPSSWQSAIGGRALTGDCCNSIIGRTSRGPSAFMFNPSDLGVKEPTPQIPMLYYDPIHPTLGDYADPGTDHLWKAADRIGGVVWPPGTKTILYYGHHGLGVHCYGEASACGDPIQIYKGTHAYPYTFYMWAYNADDFLAVKNGTKQPWQVVPYTTWAITFPFPIENVDHRPSAAYDPATQRLYLSQPYGWNWSMPLIHVYKVNIGITPPPDPTPSTPTLLRVSQLGE